VVIAYINVKKLGGTSLSEEEVRELPNSILKAERILLQTLFFDLHTLHPYSHVVNKWKALFQKCVYIPEQTKDELQQVTVNFVNDSYRTNLCLQYRVDLIAHAAIFLATLHLDVKPENILYDKKGPDAKIKITDFGLSRILTEEDIAKISTSREVISTKLQNKIKKF
jgi:serine/threonine protein kinase